MLFSTVFLLASFSALRSLAAPVPLRRHMSRAAGSGWPQSTSGDQKAAFGISGGFQPGFLQEVEGQATLVGDYPKDSYAGGKIAGFQFQADGGKDVDLDNAKEVTLTYKIQFPDKFGWAYGGKIPGLYGGEKGEDLNNKCSGGHKSDACWSARLMWREDGKGELYAYLPTANKKLPVCEKYNCDLTYGISIGTAPWFKAGQWTELVERVKLNDAGKDNGEIEVTVDGQSMVKVTGVQLRADDKGRIAGIMMHTFFGGSTDEKFKSPVAQKAYFKDFKLEVTEKLS